MRIAVLGFVVLLGAGYWLTRTHEAPVIQPVHRKTASLKPPTPSLAPVAVRKASAPSVLPTPEELAKIQNDKLTEEMLQEVAEYLLREEPEQHAELMDRYLKRRARFERTQGRLIKQLIDITNNAYDEETEMYDRERFRKIRPARDQITKRLNTLEEGYDNDLKSIFGDHYGGLKQLEEDFADYASRANNFEVTTYFPL